ncbi:nitrous oxide reductase family maturation protein NosD [Taibaiella soli]|uniref:Nitrous oxide reductase family maturation protein NosD n=1 Tax=Taibaiella soli TaxID=1649169 RepID=A0A2W2AHL2_9BACT|nr:nitrous oxide reductase family maturation protein NosD [Taibaiella soli]PZF74761.1 nitrous oxide reductase family maturation protein NosD [Taibaiella soli]
MKVQRLRSTQILLLTILFLFPATGFGKLFKVSSGSISIQSAINVAHDGDTLFITAGKYLQHDIVVNKRITILGEPNAIIDAVSKYQGFLIQHDSVFIQGIQVSNTGRTAVTDMAGIKVINAKGVRIFNCKLINNSFGIYLQNSTACTVSNNLVQSTIANEINGGNGIHAWKSGNLLINNNVVSGHRDGIYFEFVTDSKILSNRSEHNLRYGLHFMFSNNDAYSKNVFQDNGAGVAVMYSNHVLMTDNIFTHNWGEAAYGLLLKDITDSKILHNRFIKNTVAIYMEGTTRVDVKRNLIEDNGWALRVQASCSGSNFNENNFLGNSFDVATNGTLMLNYFDRNFWDKYDGYDLNKDNIGDVPYYPVSMYSVVTEKIPPAMILYHSVFTNVLDEVEKVLPTLTPDKLKDDHPAMRKIAL